MHFRLVPVAGGLVGADTCRPAPGGAKRSEAELPPSLEPAFTSTTYRPDRTSPAAKSGYSARMRRWRCSRRAATQPHLRDLLPVELGDAIHELAQQFRPGMRIAVPCSIVGRVLEPEVGGQVDDPRGQRRELVDLSA